MVAGRSCFCSSINNSIYSFGLFFLNLIAAGAHDVASRTSIQKVQMYVSQARLLAVRPGACRGLSRSLDLPTWLNTGSVFTCQAALRHEGSAAAADRKGTACMPGTAVQQVRCMSIVSRRRQQQQQSEKKAGAGDPSTKVDHNATEGVHRIATQPKHAAAPARVGTLYAVRGVVDQHGDDDDDTDESEDENTRTQGYGRYSLKSPSQASQAEAVPADQQPPEEGAVDEWAELEREQEVSQIALPMAQMKTPESADHQAFGTIAWQIPNYQVPIQPENPHGLSVSVIGIPNAGKSSLMNQLLKSKLAAVSHREQTTRERILGILTEDSKQIVLHDTPGIVNLTRARRLGLSKQVATGGVMAATETDIVLLLVDPTMTPPERQLEVLKDGEMKKVVIVINKIDKVQPRSQLLPLVDSLRAASPVPLDDIFMVSALKNSGVDDLKEYLLKQAVPRAWEYNAEQVTDMTPVKRIHEQVREKYMDIGTEVPYIFKQDTRMIKWLDDGTLLIHHAVMVKKRSQKGMLVGKAGNRVERVSALVKQDLESIFNCQVALNLSIEVNKKLDAVVATV